MKDETLEQLEQTLYRIQEKLTHRIFHRHS